VLPLFYRLSAPSLIFRIPQFCIAHRFLRAKP